MPLSIGRLLLVTFTSVSTFSLGVKDVITEQEHVKLDHISDFSSKIYKDEIPFVFLIKIEEVTGKKRMKKTPLR